MSAYVVEENSYPSADASSLFFNDYPRDGQGIGKKTMQFYPVHSLEGASTIEFCLPPLSGTETYILQEHMLAVNVELRKADGTVVPDGKLVYPANNIIGSLFSEVDVTLNGTPINAPGKLNHYKSYIKTLFNFSNDAKLSQLQICGFAMDSNGLFSSALNQGGIDRLNMFFLKNKITSATATTAKYRDEAAFLCGQLIFDFEDVPGNQGILPGITIKIILRMTTDAWRLIVPSSADTEQYKLIIKNAWLHVPVLSLSLTAMSAVEKRLSRGDKAKYKRTLLFTDQVSVTPPCQTIIHNVTLHQPNIIPSKMMLMFIKKNTFLGNYHSNPLEAKRAFRSSQQQQVQAQLFGPFGNPFSAQASAAARPIRQRRSTRRGVYNRPGNRSQSLVRRFWNWLWPSTREDEDDEVEEEAAERLIGPNVTAAADDAYVSQIEVQIDGERVDSFSFREDQFNAGGTFVRMNMANQTGFDTSASNGIPYEYWKHSCFFPTFDLTALLNANQDYMSPALRTGSLRLEIMFSKSMTEELILLVFTEYPNTIYIDHNRKVGTSFISV